MLADTDRLDNELTIAQMQVRELSCRSHVTLVAERVARRVLRDASSSCSCGEQGMRCTKTRRRLPLLHWRRSFVAAR